MRREMGKQGYEETDIFCDGVVPETNPNKKNDDFGNEERAMFMLVNVPFALFFIGERVFFDKYNLLIGLIIYLLCTPIFNIKYMKRKIVIGSQKGYPARIIAVKKNMTVIRGLRPSTIVEHYLKVKYAEGVATVIIKEGDPIRMLENPYCTLYMDNRFIPARAMYISDCKIKQEVRDEFKFWKKKK